MRILQIAPPWFTVPPSTELGSTSHGLAHVVAGYHRRHEFDVIHDHAGFTGAALGALLDGPPVVHTLHGPWTPEVAAFHRQIGDGLHRVAISHDQRSHAPDDVRVAHVVHIGLSLTDHPVRAQADADRHLAFVGPANREKGPEVAVRIARAAGRHLKMAVKRNEPPEQAYWDTIVAPPAALTLNAASRARRWSPATRPCSRPSPGRSSSDASFPSCRASDTMDRDASEPSRASAAHRRSRPATADGLPARADPASSGRGDAVRGSPEDRALLGQVPTARVGVDGVLVILAPRGTVVPSSLQVGSQMSQGRSGDNDLGPGRSPRRWSAGVLVVLTVVAITASTLAIWARETVYDTDRFMEVVEPALAHPSFYAGLSDYVSDTALEALDLDTRVAASLDRVDVYLSEALLAAVDPDPRVLEQLRAFDRPTEAGWHWSPTTWRHCPTSTSLMATSASTSSPWSSMRSGK